MIKVAHGVHVMIHNANVDIAEHDNRVGWERLQLCQDCRLAISLWH
jgi:hypothetical protein